MKPLVLYLIGGSGARFLRSLLYQLAGGLELHNTGEVKLVIIDTDESNGNYESALALLEIYQKIRIKIENESSNFRGHDNSRLFFHNVTLFDESKKFLTPLNVQQRTLGSIVDYTNLNPQQKDFVNLMLTEQELNEDLSIGFQGRPNMGTIGLEAIGPNIASSSKLNHLMGDNPNLPAESVQDARFFTVSSMFGGMGASGMPMLTNKFTNSAYNSIPLGSLCFMYYFKINEGKNNNDSKYFPQRTNLAYDYYKDDFQDKINMLYFIGKSFEKEEGVSYAPGKRDQKNKAHYIEFLSVTALIHYCQNIPNPVSPRVMQSFALHADDNLYANCAGETENKKSFEKYIRLVFIAKYYTERFERHFDSEEMKEINWVKFSCFDQFSNMDKELLSKFFKGLLEFDWDELYTYSGLRMLKANGFPNNISDVLPHKKYEPFKPHIASSKRKYNNYQEIDMKGITDSGIKSREHIPRLLSIFDRSFTAIFNNIFK